MKRPFLFVAVDNLSEGASFKTTSELSRVPGDDFGFKFNLDYILKYGTDSLRKHRETFEKPIFADLKMWNGSRTMNSVMTDLVSKGIDCLNVYALGDDLLLKTIETVVNLGNTKVFGLTVLSHYDDTYCQKHFHRTLEAAVHHFARVALNTGCHGIILPGTMLHIVKELKGLKIATGIRPEWYRDDRHKQEVTPKMAVENGADGIVCGSPIMKSPNRIEALKKVLSEMRS